jgi:low temperature requirement protein LtrA
MSITHPFKHGHTNRNDHPAIGPAVSWGPLAILAGAVAVAGAAGFYVARNHAPEMLLPAVATLFFALAALVAAITWNRVTTQSVNYRDVAGLLVLLGIGVAAAIEPDQMVQLFQGKR